jgi:hypothetical protein
MTPFLGFRVQVYECLQIDLIWAVLLLFSVCTIPDALGQTVFILYPLLCLEMVDLCPENLSNSFLLQLMRVNQSQQSLLVNTLMANQQRVVSSFLQQQPAALLPNSALENVGIYNRNNLGFQINAQNLLNANTAVSC